MPLVKGFPFPVSTQQSERHGRVKRMHMDSVQQWLNVHPPISGLRGGMVVAVVYENRDAKVDGAAASQYAILNVCCVFALAHPDSFFEECIAERKLPDWDRTFEPETLDVHVSARLDSTAHPTIRRERVRDVIVLDDLLSLGNELSAADRRIERSDQQSMIAPGQIPADRSAGESANPVRDKPFALFRDSQIVTGFSSERNCWLGRPWGFFFKVCVNKPFLTRRHRWITSPRQDYFGSPALGTFSASP